MLEVTPVQSSSPLPDLEEATPLNPNPQQKKKGLVIPPRVFTFPNSPYLDSMPKRTMNLDDARAERTKKLQAKQQQKKNMLLDEKRNRNHEQREAHARAKAAREARAIAAQIQAARNEAAEEAAQQEKIVRQLQAAMEAEMKMQEEQASREAAERAQLAAEQADNNRDDVSQLKAQRLVEVEAEVAAWKGSAEAAYTAFANESEQQLFEDWKSAYLEQQKLEEDKQLKASQSLEEKLKKAAALARDKALKNAQNNDGSNENMTTATGDDLEEFFDSIDQISSKLATEAQQFTFDGADNEDEEVAGDEDTNEEAEEEEPAEDGEEARAEEEVDFSEEPGEEEPAEDGEEASAEEEVEISDESEEED
jgi:hypothetical protein